MQNKSIRVINRAQGHKGMGIGNIGWVVHICEGHRDGTKDIGIGLG